jgi:hypothetical protein
MQLQATASTDWAPFSTEGIALSDHSPLCVSWSCRQLLPRYLRPVPKWVARHPVFMKLVSRKLEEAKLEELALYPRLHPHKSS